MQAVVCIKWKCTSTECEIRCTAYESDSITLTLPLTHEISTPDWQKNGRHQPHWERASAHLVGVCSSFPVRVCRCVRACARVSGFALPLDAPSSLLLLAGPHSPCREENSCFTSMSGCEPRPPGSPHPLRFSSSLCAVTQEHLTLTLSNPLYL